MSIFRLNCIVKFDPVCSFNFYFFLTSESMGGFGNFHAKTQITGSVTLRTMNYLEQFCTAILNGNRVYRHLRQHLA